MGTMHIVHERQNPTTSQHKVLTSSVEFVVLNGLVFTIRLGQGLGIAETSRSRSRLGLGLKGLVPIPANKQWNNSYFSTRTSSKKMSTSDRRHPEPEVVIWPLKPETVIPLELSQIG